MAAAAGVRSLVAAKGASGDTQLAAGGDCAASERSKYLLLDSRLVAKSENAKLTLGEVRKHPANPLFGEDKPWEP
jgi:hypothetical protein